jgi:hypothetical protein
MYSDQDIANLLARVQQLEIQNATKQATGLPNIKLISPNFLTRAFAVWGNFFVANLLISIAISCVFVVLGLILGNSILAIIQQWIGQIPDLSSFTGY